MRILVPSGTGARLERLTAGLSARGHELVLHEGGALSLTRRLLLARPRLALVPLELRFAPLLSALVAARVPLALDLDESARPSGLPPEGEDAAFMLAIRAAELVLASSEAAARRARALGARRVVLAPLLRLPPLLPGAREDARRALELKGELRWLAHTGPGAQLARLAEAQRRLPGVGLLVAGEDLFAHAMSMAARPSAPVIVLGAEAAPAAIWAADAAVWLGDARAPHGTDPLLLGRRAVLTEDLGLYPDELRACHTGPLDRAIASALAAEAELGPLPRAAVLAARERVELAAVRALEAL